MFPFFGFLYRFFSFLGHCYVFDCRLPTVFRQFFSTLFRFSPTSLSAFLFRTLVLSLLCLSQSFFLFRASLLCSLFVFRCCFPTVFCQFSPTLFALCRSLSFLRRFFNFFVFVSRSFSFLRHCCLFSPFVR